MTDSAFDNLIRSWEGRQVARRADGQYEIIGYFKRYQASLIDAISKSNTPSIAEICYYPLNEAEIVKAEDIMNYLATGSSYKVTLHDNEYFAQDGSLFRDVFNPKKRKLLILLQRLMVDSIPCKYVLFDKDIVINPEEPMNRFILRKLIPKISERNMKFGFSDLDANLLRPSPPVDTSSFEDIREDIAQMCHEYIRV